MMRCYEGDTYVVMVHKLYAERVLTFLYGGSDPAASAAPAADWMRVDDDDDDDGAGCCVASSKEHAAATAAAVSPDPRRVVTVLDTPAMTGVSQARRGYVVLLLEHCCHRGGGGVTTLSSSDAISSCCFSRLAPMSRQNISWAGRITHSVTLRNIRSCDTTAAAAAAASTATTTDNIGSIIWETILTMRKKADADHQTDARLLPADTLHLSNTTEMLLRVDCHPRDMVENICRKLQEAAVAASNVADASTSNNSTGTGAPRIVITDPFEGPIAMTMSRSKCTHKLTVIQSTNNENNDDDDDISFYWGLEDRTATSTMELKLNHEAAEDVIVVPADADGNDTPAAAAAAVNAKTPLSRAYYKLHQVWHDYLSAETAIAAELFDQGGGCGGAGLDLGAAPGGWTQVLVHEMRMSVVVAVDAAKLAQRVASLPAVVHIQSSMETANLRASQPYSVLVCDASVGWAVLLDLMVKVVKNCTWTVPAVAVITLKLPFKTAGSIQRHLDAIDEKLPRSLQDMQAAMYPTFGKRVKTRYRLVHLMANADSERTVIAIFEDATETQR